MKTLYFECKMGAAGDMLMAALYEICDQKKIFLQTMNQAFSEYGIQISAEVLSAAIYNSSANPFFSRPNTSIPSTRNNAPSTTASTRLVRSGTWE